MAKLVSMKLDRKKAEEMVKPTVAADAPLYPWGLNLNLDEEALKKLKVKPLPEVGATMLVTARVEVVSVSAHDSKDGGTSRSVSLQVTEMCLEADAGGDAAEMLYGRKG